MKTLTFAQKSIQKRIIEKESRTRSFQDYSEHDYDDYSDYTEYHGDYNDFSD